MDIEITHFCKRQFGKEHSGNQLNHKRVEKLIQLAQNPYAVKAGYADFTRIVILKNLTPEGEYVFPEFKSLIVNKKKALNAGAKHETAYHSRTKNELAVLTEWVIGIEPETALWIHLILYSKEQLAKEKDPIKADWGLVAVSCGLHENIEPMQPITAMRNALGTDEGGSGFPLDRKAYEESVYFWSEHIKIKPRN